MFSIVIPKLLELNSKSNNSTLLDKIKEVYKDGVSWDLKNLYKD